MTIDLLDEDNKMFRSWKTDIASRFVRLAGAVTFTKGWTNSRLDWQPQIHRFCGNGLRSLISFLCWKRPYLKPANIVGEYSCVDHLVCCSFRENEVIETISS
ncbi:hypothetical protein MHU86_6502 [Fragilaria crotonensis]|nr:hypothetical protein MHU86_6502 [Fragilaria crotonensis]